MFGMNISNSYNSINAVGGNTFMGNLSAHAGTSDDPYQISTYDDMKTLATLVNGGTAQYANSYYVVMNDIVTNEDDWVPIGTDEVPFDGVFNGNKKCISFLSKVTINSAETLSFGVFNVIGVNSEIKNFGVNWCRLDIVAEKDISVGGLICKILSNSTDKCPIIESCYSAGQINIIGNFQSAESAAPKARFGGLIGYSDYSHFITITNCFNKCNLMLSGKFSSVDFGGLAGGVLANIEKCFNSGNVLSNTKTNYSCVGGLIGYGAYNTSIKNSYNTASVVAEGGSIFAGGITSRCASIQNCYNLGNISGTVTSNGSINNLAGIVAECAASISNCVNAGKIIAIATFDNVNYLVAGVVGNMAQVNTAISDCFNYGKIEINNKGDTPSYYVGGVGASSGNKPTLSNCMYLENIFSIDVESSDELIGVSLETINLVDKYKNWENFSSIWVIKNGINNGYPVFVGNNDLIAYLTIDIEFSKYNNGAIIYLVDENNSILSQFFANQKISQIFELLNYKNIQYKLLLNFDINTSFDINANNAIILYKGKNIVEFSINGESSCTINFTQNDCSNCFVMI